MLVVPTETQIECHLPNDGYTQDIKDVETWFIEAMFLNEISKGKKNTSSTATIQHSNDNIRCLILHFFWKLQFPSGNGIVRKVSERFENISILCSNLSIWQHNSTAVARQEHSFTSPHKMAALQRSSADITWCRTWCTPQAPPRGSAKNYVAGRLTKVKWAVMQLPSKQENLAQCPHNRRRPLSPRLLHVKCCGQKCLRFVVAGLPHGSSSMDNEVQQLLEAGQSDARATGTQ